ncbi:TetR/AcrR family transcriptional regulator [Methylomonas fluvii]|uniref:TetR/AcrR family transcriptional regulator n=1 Tax=Methylomonas fluvii TaxID=1854564 RepID=A0ABR9DIV9_9GAMM|nr:TetR/AcrR family transcriptional regulator [Methylomonas fluvii]MBD9362558.1 TetR/AcrR family transcriptional regulator [Methylomonas fluvii]MBD9363046.1 TetR/AcrR family transcriptional regulator [Methylomonas fluvii]CAD6875670.1 Transcriptional regulator, AcrR family [Methylomonas fluvii]
MNDISDPVYARLLKAALECFLSDEYHKVTTRMIAEKAEANISMIRYYFGNKEGLYEEMIRETLKPLLDMLDSDTLSEAGGFAEYLRLYYDTMRKHPEFPKLILKVLALNHGPGRRFILQLLERGRSGGARRLEQLKASGQVDRAINPDVARMAFVSLAMMPMLLKDIFEEQMGGQMDEAFLNELATLNGKLLVAGMAATQAGA